MLIDKNRSVRHLHIMLHLKYIRDQNDLTQKYSIFGLIMKTYYKNED